MTYLILMSDAFYKQGQVWGGGDMGGKFLEKRRKYSLMY
jgi:hypothetical protein